MREILAATTNRFKLRELQGVAAEFGWVVISPDELRDRNNLAEPPKVVEDATDYLGNATLKADAFARWGSCSAIADDSGLEITALNGEPGLYSARFGGEGISDDRRCELLLNKLEGESDRRARYRCVLVAVVWDPKGGALYPERLSAESELEGHILTEPRGRHATQHGGFGYNPIVYIDSLGGTLAELPFETICREGFRARAAQTLFTALIHHPCHSAS